MAGKGSQGADFQRMMKRLATGSIDPVYYLFGSERLLVDRLFSELVRQVVDGNRNDLDCSMQTAGTQPLIQTLDLARTYPMLRAKRLAVVREAEKLKADDWAAFARYLEDPPETTCLVMIGLKKPDARSKAGASVSRILKKNNWLHEFAPLKDRRQILPFLDAELKVQGKKMESRAQGTLLDLIGNDLSTLVGAIERLSLYVGDEEVIGLDAVEKLVAQTRIEDIWDYQDALAARNFPKAFSALMRLEESRQKPDEYLLLLGTIHRHFRALWTIRSLRDRRMTLDQVKTIVGGHPFVIKRQFEQAGRIDLSVFPVVFDALSEADRRMKSSALAPSRLFERMTRRICFAGGDSRGDQGLRQPRRL